MVHIVKVRGVSLHHMHCWNLLRILQREDCLNMLEMREFTPYAANAKRSRLEQEVNIDFIKEKFSHMQMLVSSQ